MKQWLGKKFGVQDSTMLLSLHCFMFAIMHLLSFFQSAGLWSVSWKDLFRRNEKDLLVFWAISCELNIENASSPFVFYLEDVFVSSLRQSENKGDSNFDCPCWLDSTGIHCCPESWWFEVLLYTAFLALLLLMQDWIGNTVDRVLLSNLFLFSDGDCKPKHRWQTSCKLRLSLSPGWTRSSLKSPDSCEDTQSWVCTQLFSHFAAEN